MPLYTGDWGTFFNETFFNKSRNWLPELLPDFAYLSETVRVIDVANTVPGMVLQILMNGELDEAIIHGAVKRIRPKMMTVAAAFMGLLPIMWSTSAGADVMKRIAAPMIGGLITSFIMELLVYPAIYKLWKQRELQPTTTAA